MTTHYNTSSDVKLRCDGDHEWGEPSLTSSYISVVLEDGEICVKVVWSVHRTCTKDYTNNVRNAYTKCQKSKLVDNGSKTIPLHTIDSLK